MALFPKTTLSHLNEQITKAEEKINEELEQQKENFSSSFNNIGSSISNSIKSMTSQIGQNIKENQVQTWTSYGTVTSSTGSALVNIASTLGSGNLSLSSYGVSLSSFKNVLANSSDNGFKELRELIEDYSISAGAAFLKGNVTSAFAQGVQNIGAVQNTLKSVINSKQIYDNIAFIKENGGEMLKTAIESAIYKISKDVVSTATTGALNMGKTLVNYGKAVPERIMSYATSYFNTYKPNISDILKQFMSDKEEEEEKKREEKKQSKFLRTLANIDNTATNITYKVSNITGTINDSLNEIFAYSSAGMPWVNNQINNLVDETNTLIHDTTSQWEKQAKKYIDNVVYTQGTKNGKIMVEAYKNLLKKAQKKIEDLKSEKLTSTIILATSLIQKAKLKIMSLTGINIPL